MSLRKFDLNLLVVFQAVIEQRSVAGAAKQVGLSASAVSHALGRLRATLNDELFVRTSHGLEPTPRALELTAEVAAGLDHLDKALTRQTSFDPATSERVFALQITDYVSGILLPELAQRLRREAPGVSVQVHPFSFRRTSEHELADVQIRFTPGENPPADTRTQRLLNERFMVVMRPDHPAAETELTVERYAALPHLRLSPAATGTTMVDDALARRGLERRTITTVPSWFDIPGIIEKTDMVAIVPVRWPMADARLSALHSVPLPLDDVRFALDMCWDLRREMDPGHKWLRHHIADIFKDAHAG